jgi:dolichol-phosphate mannosyltransferase
MGTDRPKTKVNRSKPSKDLVLSEVCAADGSRFSWFKRYIKFCLVGGSGVFVDMAVIYLLAGPHGLGWSLTLSKVIAAEAAILNNFTWNDLWTFRDLVRRGSTAGDEAGTKTSDGHASSWRGVANRLIRFNLICTSGIALSVLLLNAQVHLLGLNLFLSNFVAIVLVSFWNFFLNLKWGGHIQTKNVSPLTALR